MAWEDDLITLLTDPGPGAFVLALDLFDTTRATIPRLVGSGTIAIVSTNGGKPERTQNSVIKPAYVHVGAQLRARADTPQLAEATARRAYDRLVGIRNVLIGPGPTPSGAVFYREIDPMSEPYDMNVDSHDQSSFVFNIRGVKRYSPGD